MNKNIERDEMWRGRFVVSQSDRAQFFEDNLYVSLKLFDKETGKTAITSLEPVFSWAFLNGYKIWSCMNKFILCCVYGEKGELSDSMVSLYWENT